MVKAASPPTLERFELQCLRRLGLLLGITQRTVTVKSPHNEKRFITRKLIPVNPKTLGDHILLKRIKADLSQPELAVKAGVSVRKVKAWEYDQIVPTTGQWQILVVILKLNLEYLKV